MFRSSKKVILSFMMMCGLGLGFLSTPVVALWDDVCNDINNTQTEDEVKQAVGCDSTGATVETTMQNSVRPVINAVLGVVGVIAVIVIVVAGINMSSSQGDPGKVAKARNAIIFAVVGLLIALLAFAIVNFMMAEVFG